jgi:hypothetical protein
VLSGICSVNSVDAISKIANINNKNSNSQYDKFSRKEYYFITAQFYNYYFQNEENNFINSLYIEQSNVNRINTDLLNKTSSIIISLVKYDNH